MINTIIHITLGKANPNRLNGVNKVVDSVMNAQFGQNQPVEFWGITKEVNLNYPERKYRTRLFKDSWSKFKLDRRLVQAIKELDPASTVIHLHGGFLPQLFSVAYRLRKAGVRYFFTPHGAYNLVALERSKYRKLIYIKLFERFVVNHASGVQLLGESEKEGTSKYFNTTLFLIPNGQDVSSQKPIDTDASACLKLGFVGRIDIHTKGLDLLLDGVELALKDINLSVEIIGDGRDVAAFKRIVNDKGLNHKVKFIGSLFGPEKMAKIAAWDALCLVSRNEGLPGVVLEAASVGVPAIVSQETNMGRYIKKYSSGWVLDHNNADQLAETIVSVRQLKEKNGLKPFKENAQFMICEAFDWMVIGNQCLAMYA